MGRQALQIPGLLELGPPPPMEPLTGGVSSDIWLVHIGRARYAVKRALPQLKVAADWKAPVERSRYEAAWMAEAALAVPQAVPPVVHVDEISSTIVMDYLDPAIFRNWKDMLQNGEADRAFAAKVGLSLVRIHAATAGREDVAARFDSAQIFYAIRLEPYLLATAEVHRSAARALKRLARRTADTQRALVHGDVSPKNILVGPAGPVFLDAECACYGDPAFDLAFCLNHLLLKGVWKPRHGMACLACFEALERTYLSGVSWEPADALEERAASLLPGLLLGRIDGKSPVEYITTRIDKDRVRRVALAFLERPPLRLADIRRAWAEEIVT